MPHAHNFDEYGYCRGRRCDANIAEDWERLRERVFELESRETDIVWRTRVAELLFDIVTLCDYYQVGDFVERVRRRKIRLAKNRSSIETIANKYHLRSHEIDSVYKAILDLWLGLFDRIAIEKGGAK